MAHVTSCYESFCLEAFVFRGPDAARAGRKHDRLLAVSVQITNVAASDPASPLEPKVVRLERRLFDSIGVANRARDKSGGSLSDGIVRRRTTEV